MTCPCEYCRQQRERHAALRMRVAPSGDLLAVTLISGLLLLAVLGAIASWWVRR